MARELVEVIAPWREDVLRIEGALPRLDQLADDLQAKHDRNATFLRLLTALDVAGVARRVKTRALRILDLVSRVLIAGFTEQGLLEAECLVEYQLPAAQVASVVASVAACESALQHG